MKIAKLANNERVTLARYCCISKSQYTASAAIRFISLGVWRCRKYLNLYSPRFFMRNIKTPTSGGWHKGTKTSAMSIALIVLVAVVAISLIIVLLGRKAKPKQEITFEINGERSTASINPNKLQGWLKEKQANELNPQSCPRTPNADEVAVPISLVREKRYFAGLELWEQYDSDYNSASFRGYNNFVMKKADYEKALAYAKKQEEEQALLNRTAQLNNEGTELEAAGNIDDAISVYEENVRLGYPAHHSYKRLMVLYRKRKDYDNEKRIIEAALAKFPNFEEYRVRLARLEYKRSQAN